MNTLKIILGAALFVAAPFYGKFLNHALDLKDPDTIVGAMYTSIIAMAGIALIVWAVSDIINKKH